MRGRTRPSPGGPSPAAGRRFCPADFPGLDGRPRKRAAVRPFSARRRRLSGFSAPPRSCVNAARGCPALPARRAPAPAPQGACPALPLCGSPWSEYPPAGAVRLFDLRRLPPHGCPAGTGACGYLPKVQRSFARSTFLFPCKSAQVSDIFRCFFAGNTIPSWKYLYTSLFAKALKNIEVF